MPNGQVSPTENDACIDLVMISRVLWRRRFIIISVVSLATLLTGLHQYGMAKPVYRSNCTILPTAEKTPNNFAAHLGALGGVLGISGPQGPGNLELLLKSRSLQMTIMERLSKREQAAGQERPPEGGPGFNLGVTSKMGCLNLSWEDENPDYSRQALECTLVVLSERVKREQEERRTASFSFLEGRLSDAKRDLENAEEDLKTFQVTCQGLNLEDQARAIIDHLSGMKKVRLEKVTEVNMKKMSLSPDNFEVRALELSIEELDRRMAELTNGMKHDETTASSNITNRTLLEIPALGLEYSRKLRNVQLRQKVLGMITEQFELAKLENHMDEPRFQVIDEPYTLDAPVRPRKVMAVASAAMFSFLGTITAILLAAFLGTTKKEGEKDRG